MKRVLIITGLFLVTFTTLQAQQLPLYNQYMMNGFLLNPAMAGSQDFMPLILTVRNQWAGVEGAPTTQTISMHAAPFKNKALGVGGNIYNDGMGPVSRIGLLGSFAYHITLKEGMKLGLGMSLSGFQNKVDFGKIKFANQDKFSTAGVESSFVPDANFGAYLYGKKYFAGLSVAQLFQWNVKMSKNELYSGTAPTETKNTMVRHYFITGGYRFDLGTNIILEPSALIKTTENKSPMQFDLNAKVYIKKNYWAGISYRTKDAIIVMGGMKYNTLIFGYSFDYSFSSLSKGTYGSHEFMIGINFGENKAKGSSLL